MIELMLLRLLAEIPPHEQVWGQTEDFAIIAFFVMGGLMTLAVGALFVYIIFRGEES